MKLNHEDFFTGMREAWGALSQKKVNALTALLDFVESDEEMSDVRWIAYAFATIKHETAHTYEPIAEYGKGKGKPYGKADPITGQRYYGRGYVQITWKKNYEKLGQLLSVDLVDRPDLAMEPDTAYQILSLGMRDGLFTGKKLSHYIHDETCDYLHARRIINGMDRAPLIAGYAKQFETILEGAAEDDTEQATVATSTTTTTTTGSPPEQVVKVEEKVSLISKVTENEKAKEIAGTGLTTIGNKLATGGISGGMFAAIGAFLEKAWPVLIFAAVLIILGFVTWWFIYNAKQKQKLLEGQIAADRSRQDISFGVTDAKPEKK